MSRLTLTEQIDRIDFSDDAAGFFTALSQYDAADEGAAIVLVAAAQLLARQHCDDTPRENDALISLCDEFIDLVFETRARLKIGRCRPGLRIVAGTDVTPSTPKSSINSSSKGIPQ